MRIFRLRTLTGSNITAVLTGAAIFSQFFLLTLYMQQVLHYSALQTGAAYLAFTLSIIGFSGVSQAVVTRVGIRRVLPVGLTLAAAGLLVDANLPVHGHYFWNLFPAFLVGGIGMAFAFVPMSIGALSGVEHRDAGVASGLLNTSQQIGGAIGVAVATTIATTFTAHYVSSHPGSNGLAPAALTHGFQVTFYVLAAIALLSSVLAFAVIESRPRGTRTDATHEELVPALEEAA
jgi:MFS family permease